MKKVDKPLPMTLIKKAPLKTYLLQRVKEKHKPRFTRVGGETYVAVADFVERAVKQFGNGGPRGSVGTNPPKNLLTVSKVCQLHMYNMQRIHPELNIDSVKAEFVERIASRLVVWLDGAIHEHPSIGSTFTIK